MGSEITRDILYDFYWNKDMIQREIAKTLKVGRGKIIELMRKYKIPTRGTRFKSELAVKDNKIFAVEVESDLPIPVEKYDGIDYFDDIHWVIIKGGRR